MILWWIGDIVLLVVVLPIVVYLLRGVLSTARGDRPARRDGSPEPQPPDRGTSTPCRCC